MTAAASRGERSFGWRCLARCTSSQADFLNTQIPNGFLFIDSLYLGSPPVPPTPARDNTPIQKWGWYEVDKHFIMISGCREWRVCAVCAVVCSGSVRRWTAETDWRNLPSSCARTLLVGRLLVAPSVLRVWWWAQKSAVASGREEGICSASHVLMADGASDQTNG